MRKKIIIIGAGIAGLAACARLIEYGFDATILEARNRAGGRIWTDYQFGIPFNCGAGWIHGIDENPIALLAKQFHAKMMFVDPNKFATFDRHGKIISPEDVRKFDAKFDLMLTQAKDYAYQAKQDMSLATALSHFMKIENLTPLEQDLFKRKLLFFENYIGAGYDFLSARHWDQEETWPGDNGYLTASYQPIIDGLLKNCPIQFNTYVTKINIRENNVEVVAENSVCYADAVVVTVPLGVLKKNLITFNPPLPSDKQQAIQQLEMGLFNITALKFSKSFWPNEWQFIFFSQFDNLSISAFFNLCHFTQEPILIGYSGGEKSRLMENLSDAELIEKTMKNLRKVFGSHLPEPENYVNTRWAHDLFSYGSYSYIKTGASGNEYEKMTQPVSDCLFFAGEATSAKYPATTHGAYLSGIREAERIKSLFS